MLTAKTEFVHVAEVNPPSYPDMSHHKLEGSWQHLLITDNVFGRIRVSPFAFGARLTHDLPDIHPTIVVSTRDRNVLAIESEVRGALWNGIDSFLVVIGDTYPAVDHQSHHFEIVEHLRRLQEKVPTFEVGMPARFQRWHMQRRIDLGAQFFVTGPILDPATVGENLGRLQLGPEDPPVYLAVIPAFSGSWIDRAEQWGAIPASAGLRRRLEELPERERRQFGWAQAAEVADRAAEVGAAGIILMGLKFETLVTEAGEAWSAARR